MKSKPKNLITQLPDSFEKYCVIGNYNKNALAWIYCIIIAGLMFVLMAHAMKTLSYFQIILWLLLQLAISYMIMPLHESLHWLGYKLAGYNAKIDFGHFPKNNPHVECEDAYLTKSQVVLTLLLPCIVLNLIMVIILILCPGIRTTLLSLILLNFAGYRNDIFEACQILKLDKNLLARVPGGYIEIYI